MELGVGMVNGRKIRGLLQVFRVNEAAFSPEKKLKN